MSLAWTTIVVLITLLPGFLFFVGLYAPDRLSRDVGPSNPFTQLSAFVFFSFVIHTAFVALIESLCHYTAVPCVNLTHFFALLQLQGADKINLDLLEANLEQHVLWIFFYFILTGACGFGVGLLLGRQILAGRLRWFNQNRWFSELIVGKEESLVVAYILTRIAHENKFMMYQGFVEEISLTREGKISYLVLTGAVRYYMTFSDKAPVTSDPLKQSLSTQGQVRAEPGVVNTAEHGSTLLTRQWSVLVVEGEDIANVVFDRFDFEGDVAALAAEGPEKHAAQPGIASS